MNALWNITKKELKELLTPSSIVSVVIVVVMFAALGTMINSTVEDVTSPSEILLINQDSDGYGVEIFNQVYDAVYGEGMAEEYVTYVTESDISDQQIYDLMTELGMSDAMVIASGFSSNIHSDPMVPGVIDQYYIYTSAGMFGSTTSMILPEVISNMNYLISTELLGPEEVPKLNPISYTNINTFVNGNMAEGVTPALVDGAVMGQTMMMPIIIMIIIVMIGSIVIGSVGNEKENKTLETLLTLPVKRTVIVAGKLLASAITGLVFGAAYMLGMMMYMGSLMNTMTGDVTLESLGMALGLVDWAMVLVVLFLAILSALGLCMILGAFTKNYKAAQTMTLPISVLAMIPMFILMFMGWESLSVVAKVLLFIIPFTHPMMVMNNLMFGNIELVILGMGYLLVFTAVIIYITVRLYKSDILITGLSQNPYVVKLKSIFTKKS